MAPILRTPSCHQSRLPVTTTDQCYHFNMELSGFGGSELGSINTFEIYLRLFVET